MELGHKLQFFPKSWAAVWVLSKLFTFVYFLKGDYVSPAPRFVDNRSVGSTCKHLDARPVTKLSLKSQPLGEGSEHRQGDLCYQEALLF